VMTGLSDAMMFTASDKQSEQGETNELHTGAVEAPAFYVRQTVQICPDR
jgi:hypothetical protein